MKTRFILLPLLVATLLAGCATADKLNDIRIGMTQDQVIALMGKPDSKSAQANIEYLTYYLSNDSGRSAYTGDQPYLIRLVDGKVESFGRFAQLYDMYNRPVGGGAPQLGAGIGIPQFGGTTYATSTVLPIARTTDLATQLQRLKTLKDQGVLTDAEFLKAKQQLLPDSK